VDVISDIVAFQEKFNIPGIVAGLDRTKLMAFLDFRIRFLQEELDEIMTAKTGCQLVDGLVDLTVVALGTLVAFGIDVGEAWRRVHQANIIKEPGVNPNRPNPFGLPDLVKPPGWTHPKHHDNIGILTRLFHRENTSGQNQQEA
jgi:predicted HAD superfamily Cof-like phosphohydrolase